MALNVADWINLCSMGYAIPAGCGIRYVPEQFVLGFVGDGGFMMSGMELMTAVQHKLSPMIVVFNNSSYGTIRMHQEKLEGNCNRPY